MDFQPNNNNEFHQNTKMEDRIKLKEYSHYFTDDKSQQATWNGVIAKMILLMIPVVAGLVFEFSTHMLLGFGILGWILFIGSEILLIMTLMRNIARGTASKNVGLIFLAAALLGVTAAYSIEIGVYWILSYFGGLEAMQIVSKLYPILVLSFLITGILVVVASFWSKVVKIRPKAMGIVGMAFLGMGLLWLLAWILSIFGLNSLYMALVDLIFNGPIAIVIAAFLVFFITYLLSIFIWLVKSLIHRGVRKELEWFFAFRLVYLVVEIYIKVVRLLLLLASN